MTLPLPPPSGPLAEYLDQLQASCQSAGLPCPLPPDLLNKLRRQPPPGAVHRMAKVLSQAWGRGEAAAAIAPWQLQALVDAVAQAHAAQPLEMEADSALPAAWARAQVLRGQTDALRAWVQGLVAYWATRPGPWPPAAGPLLQVLRQTGQREALKALLAAMAPRLGGDVGLAGPWVAGLVAVSREAGDEAPPADLAGPAAWLERAWPVAGPAPAWWVAWSGQHMGALAHLVLRLLRLDLAGHWLARALPPTGEPAPDPGWADATAKLLRLLAVHGSGADVLPWADRAAAHWPGHPGIRTAQLRAWAECGAGPERLEGVLEVLDTTHPGHAACVRLLGELAFEAGHMGLARQVLAQQAAAGTLDDTGALRLRHLTLREAPPESTAAAAPASPAEALPGLAALALFQAGLQPMADILLRPPLHQGRPTAEGIQADAERALAHFIRHLRQQPPVPLPEVLAAVTALWVLANAGALELRHWKGTFPFDFGPDFGTHDPLRASAQCEGVLRHLVALVRHTLNQLPPSRAVPGEAAAEPVGETLGEAGLGELMQLVKWAVDAHVALEQPEEALADLALLRHRLGPVGAQALRATEEHACLEAGLLARAQQARQSLPAAAPWAVWPLRAWDDWAAATGRRLQVLDRDEATPGQWDIVMPDGRTRVGHHQALATELSGLAPGPVEVRHGHLLIHADGGILQPHAWHRQMGPFPFPHPSVLNRGLRGATLSLPVPPVPVDEPLVVLANMDATFHRNYYHWMVLTLTRILAAQAHGLLADRRLLLPAELAGWMKSSLRDIGLAEQQVRFEPQDQALALSDAWVLGPLEFASARGNERLRQRLWRAAGLDPDQPPTPTRCLYITRSGEFRRPFREEHDVAAAAAELGYECLAPERLPLLEQVRLFAQARVIAGPPGAAYTNLMWAQAGTQVLSFFKEEINGPTFLDLSFLRGQRHRWVQGRSLPGFEAISVVTAPYSVDLQLARRELARALHA